MKAGLATTKDLVNYNKDQLTTMKGWSFTIIAQFTTIKNTVYYKDVKIRFLLLLIIRFLLLLIVIEKLIVYRRGIDEVTGCSRMSIIVI